MSTLALETSNFAEQLLMKRAAEFKLCISLHRLAVQDLSQIVMSRRPEAFPRLASNPELVSEFFELHDQSKLEPRYFWDLLGYFGIDINLLNKIQKSKALSLIQEVNKRDALHAQMFFVSNRMVDREGQPNETAKELLRLEKICDVVERGLSQFPKVEFGRKLSRGSQFLSDPADIELALWLENNYGQI